MTEKIRTVSFSGVESDSDAGGHDSLNTSIISDNVSSIMSTSTDSHMKTSLNIAHNIGGVSIFFGAMIDLISRRERLFYIETNHKTWFDFKRFLRKSRRTVLV
jgi:hypothetical protein